MFSEAQFIQVLVIVFRECFEAVLILSLLNTILQKYDLSLKQKWVFRSGIMAGFILSAVIGFALYHIQSSLDGASLDYFQLSLLTVGALLITQMCLWMQSHAKNLKQEYDAKISKQVQDGAIWGLAAIALVSILREGVESVLFVLGILGSSDGAYLSVIPGASVGIILGLATYYFLRKGVSWIKPKYFFPATTAFLLLTASGFLSHALRGAIQSEILPSLKDAFWDSSVLLDEASSVGGFFQQWFGYQSQPALLTVIILSCYWLLISYFLIRKSKTTSN